MQGKVYLIGAGPGDPGLLTLKGLQCLKKAQVVVYDHLAAISLLAHAQPNAEFIYAGKEAGAHTIPQTELNRLLVTKAQEGKTVARLKGGDPYVFGRGGEEALELAQAGIPFEVVPGISSAIAGPMYAGIPVTHRGVAAGVTIITGHEAPDKAAPGHNWQALAQTKGTLVFLMAMQNLKEITATLLKYGKSPATPVAVIQNATTTRQRTLLTTLAELPHDAERQNFAAPALVVIGNVVELGPKLGWFDKKPLFGQKILLTRTGQQALTMAATLNDLGAECISLPVIKIKPLPDTALKQALDALQIYQWLIFTSSNAVELFFETLFTHGRDSRALHGLKVAAIGAVTAQKLQTYGIAADVIPQQFVAESLSEALDVYDLKGARILLPRAKDARETLPESLRDMGATIDIIPLYETIPAVVRMENLNWLDDINIVTFTSASTVNMLKAALPSEKFTALSQKAIAACIGPITANAAQNAGFRHIITAAIYTAEGLCETIINELSQ